MPINVFSLKNVTYTYPDGTRAIDDLSLEIPQGKKIAILGGNGSGKTTLFLLLNGIYNPSRGKIDFRNEPIRYNAKSLLQLRSQVGVVFQDPDSQMFSVNVYEEISFGLLNLGIDPETAKTRIEKTLKDLHLDHLKTKPPHLLSYGEKKRVSIASILAMEPSVILLDEPSSGLDPAETKNLIDLIENNASPDKTIILSTHNVNLAYDWADHIIIMHRGKHLLSGKPHEIFRNDSILDQANLEKPFIEDLLNRLGIIGNFPADKKISLHELTDFMRNLH